MIRKEGKGVSAIPASDAVGVKGVSAVLLQIDKIRGVKE